MFLTHPSKGEIAPDHVHTRAVYSRHQEACGIISRHTTCCWICSGVCLGSHPTRRADIRLFFVLYSKSVRVSFQMKGITCLSFGQNAS